MKAADIYTPQDLSLCKTHAASITATTDIYTPQDLSLCKTITPVSMHWYFIYTPQDLSLCKTSNPAIQFSESWMSLSEVHLSLNE